MILLALAGLTGTAMAQQAVKTPGTVDKVRRWSIGTDLTPVFRSNSALGVNIKFSPKGTGAIRLYNSYISSGSNTNSTSLEHRTDSWITNLGYEWRKTENKWTVHYGADAIFTATYDRTGSGDNNRVEEGGLGVKIFVGASYRVGRRISISTEFGKQLVGTTSYTYTNGVRGNRVENFYDNFNTNQILMINYHF